MPTVKTGVGVADPTHEFSLSYEGQPFGFHLYKGEASLVEVPSTPPSSTFQWSQKTWEGGRANARATTDQTAYLDAQNAWTLTPEVLHPVPQWGVASGLVSSDVYCPQTRNVSWKALVGTERYVASSFVAGASYTATRAYIWLRAVKNPGTMTLEIWSDTAGTPNAVLKTQTITTTTVTDVLSLWQRFPWASGQSLTSGTTYWIVAYGASGDTAENHWEVGIDAAPSTFSKYSTAGSVWATATYKMYFRSLAAPLACTQTFPFEYYGAQFLCVKYDSAAVSKLFINGDLGKASAGTSTTITKTASGGLTWTTNQLAGAYLRIVAGTGAGTKSVVIASHTSGTTPVFTTSGFDVTPDSTSIFIVYATLHWSEITSPASGLGSVSSPPAIAGQTVYFPQGATAIRRMYFDEATGAYVFAADSTNTADFVRLSNDNIWKTYISGQKYVASSAPLAASKGTNLAFVGSYPVGGTDFKVTSMSDHKGSLFIPKSDGLYSISNGRVTRINYGGESIPHIWNGRVSISFQDSLYFSFLSSMERLTNSTINDIGWWRHEGMPQNREGPAVGAATFLSWLFVGIGVDVDTAGTSCVLCWNGAGWHEVFRAFSDGHRVSGVALQPNFGTRPRLWVFVENDAYFIDFPKDAVNPLRDNGMVYMHECSLVTSTIDLNKVNFQKIFKSLLLQTKNLSSTAYVEVDYQLDNGIGDYTYTSSGRSVSNPLPWINAGRVQLSPTADIAINRGNANMIRLRFRIYTESCYIPPIVYEAQLSGSYIEPPRWQWNVTVKVDSNSSGATSDFKPDDIVDFLIDASSNMKLLTCQSKYPRLDDKRVFASLPVINRESMNDAEKKWSGRITFTLKEPG